MIECIFRVKNKKGMVMGEHTTQQEADTHDRMITTAEKIQDVLLPLLSTLFESRSAPSMNSAEQELFSEELAFAIAQKPQALIAAMAEVSAGGKPKQHRRTKVEMDVARQKAEEEARQKAEQQTAE